MADIDELRVEGPPELLEDLRRWAEMCMDSRELTEYAIAHGVKLPARFDADRVIVMTWTEDGEEIGLLWDDPDTPEAI